VAAAVNADPIEFRLRYIKETRDVAVIKAAAERPTGTRGPRRARTRPAAKCRDAASPTRNATARVSPLSRKSRSTALRQDFAKKFTVAHDCGQLINPDGLVKCVEGNIVQGVSRTPVGGSHLRQEGGDQRRLDQLSDPRHHETPGQNRRRDHHHPEIAPSGAGEPSIRPVAAAIANANLRRHRRAHPARAVLAERVKAACRKAA